MKNRTAKILSAVLTLCVAICAIFSLTVFADEATNLSAVKNADGVIDFEGATPGSITASTGTVKFTQNSTTSASIVDLGEDDPHGQVFQSTKSASTGATSALFTMKSSSNVNTAIITFKMRILSGSNRLRVYPASTGNDTHAQYIDFRLDGSNIEIDAGGWKKISGVTKDDWFDVKFVYYEGDSTGSEGSSSAGWVNTKLSVYVNDVLYHEVTSFNRWYTADTMGRFGISTVSATLVNAQFDDIKVEHKNIVTPEITNVNVSYGDYLYLYYAVPKSTVPSDAAPKLVGTANGVSFESTKYTEEKVEGVDCYVFKSVGIPPKEINTKVTVKIVAGDAVSDSLTYSVEQYLYDRLYNEGYVLEGEVDNASIGENDGKDNIRKKFS